MSRERFFQGERLEHSLLWGQAAAPLHADGSFGEITHILISDPTGGGDKIDDDSATPTMLWTKDDGIVFPDGKGER